MKEQLLGDLLKWLLDFRFPAPRENERTVEFIATDDEKLKPWSGVEQTFTLNPDNQICVAERRGLPSFGYDINHGIQHRSIEFICRSKTLESAFIRCQRIYDAIEMSNREIWLNGDNYCNIVPRSLPSQTGIDANLRYEVSFPCNLITRFNVR
jgi:hypothetical protein